MSLILKTVEHLITCKKSALEFDLIPHTSRCSENNMEKYKPCLFDIKWKTYLSRVNQKYVHDQLESNDG